MAVLDPIVAISMGIFLYSFGPAIVGIALGIWIILSSSSIALRRIVGAAALLLAAAEIAIIWRWFDRGCWDSGSPCGGFDLLVAIAWFASVGVLLLIVATTVLRAASAVRARITGHEK